MVEIDVQLFMAVVSDSTYKVLSVWNLCIAVAWQVAFQFLMIY